MNDLSITIVDGDLQSFQLADYPRCKKYKDAGTYTFEARDMKTRDHWGNLIQKKLWVQLEKFKSEKVSQIYFCNLNKFNSFYIINTYYYTYFNYFNYRIRSNFMDLYKQNRKTNVSDESKSYKAVSRANSTSSARYYQPVYSSNSGKYF